jgi:hypothetical protein
MKLTNVSKLDSQKLKAQGTGGKYDGSYGARTDTTDKTTDNVKNIEADPNKVVIPENSPAQEPKATSLEEPKEGNPTKEVTSVIEPDEKVVMAPGDCDQMQGTTGTYDGSYGGEHVVTKAEGEDEDEDEKKKKEEEAGDVQKESAKKALAEQAESPTQVYKRLMTAVLPKTSDISVFGVEKPVRKANTVLPSPASLDSNALVAEFLKHKM